MVFIHLDEEEKLEILFLALCLFSLASVISVCLAATFCPLNKWLLSKQLRKKQKRLQQQHQQQQLNQQHLYQNSQHSPRHLHSGASFRAPILVGQARHYYLNQRLQHTNFKDSLASYLGPPPAYEAALRATRLQSLTGSPPALLVETQKPAPTGGEEPRAAARPLATEAEQWKGPSLDQERQLDFGDYFHQPRDAEAVNAELSSSPYRIPMASSGTADCSLDKSKQKQPPVMLRLWAKLLEPGELIERAKRMDQEEEERKRKLAEQEESLSLTVSRKLSLTRQLSIPQFFGSLVTRNSSSSNKSPVETSEADLTASQQQHLSSLDSNSSSDQSNGAPEAERTGEGARKRTKSRSISLENSENNNKTLNLSDSITSRVLHMNVASFSYVKDETLISTKKHNQFNYHHFFSRSAPADGQKSGKNKFCQLLISVCDVENVLNSSWLNEKSCALLANYSAIYIQCEILLQKSKSARLLAPLKVLQSHSNQEQDSQSVNFASSISAAAVERSTIISFPQGATLLHQSIPSSTTDSESLKSSSFATSCNSESSSGQGSLRSAPSTNWRHEPSADGKSIVVFSSVPKEIAHQQQLSASVLALEQKSLLMQEQQQQQQTPDLIQFDSVFVSPILSKSTIEDGFIRFRIYSQCKYVNETCLAELKLPLKQLLLSETNDNLSDVNSKLFSNNSRQQSDIILDNLLKNLVTASTGSTLSSLIERISSEERAEAEEEKEALAAEAEVEKKEGPAASFKSILLPWTACSSPAPAGGGGRSLRGSYSFNDSLNRLGASCPAAASASSLPQASSFVNQERRALGPHQSTEELEKRLEQNYHRSLMVSHWLNYLIAPSYECQLVEETRGKIIIGLSYLPTSNRVIFNAHRASINDDSYANGKYLMKNLRLQSSTCYLLRFLMIVNGRVVKRKQTPAARKPEWDSQEPITFDLVSVSVEQPSFIVSLVMRNLAIPANNNSSQFNQAPPFGSLQNVRFNSQLMCNNNNNAGKQHVDVQSEPEYGSAIYQQQRHACAPGQVVQSQERDLVIGHLVLADEIWREMKSQPRKQIVRQFKML